jgi:hypothetical protein
MSYEYMTGMGFTRPSPFSTTKTSTTPTAFSTSAQTAETEPATTEPAKFAEGVNLTRIPLVTRFIPSVISPAQSETTPPPAETEPVVVVDDSQSGSWSWLTSWPTMLGIGLIGVGAVWFYFNWKKYR